MILKQQVIRLGIFIDNIYLDFYLDIINNNLNREKEKDRTNKHHFIPICYYKSLINDDNLSKKEKDKLAIIKANSDPNNFLVNLLYKDHILVHYYLCLCTEDNLKYRLANAFFRLTNRKWKYTEFNPEIDLEKYQELYEFYKRNRDKVQFAKIMREKMTGNQYRRGFKDTEEHKKAIGDANRHPRSKETKLKISNTWKIKASIEGNNVKGKKWSLESKQKQSIIMENRNCTWCKKQVKCLETGDIFNSITEANKWIGKKQQVNNYLNGKCKFAGKLEDGTKLHWELL